MADDEDLTLDLSVKKKKKSKAKVVIEDDQPQSGEPEPGAEEEDLELDLAKSKKKKPKKAKEVKLSDDEDEKEDKAAFTALAEGTGRMNLLDARDPAAWTDYSYDDLLDLVFGIMREKNPDMASGKRRTFVMKPPQVQRAGSKKTAFTNFAEICRLLKRETKHVLQYLMAELGTTGSIDGNQCLIVKGRFQQKHFENVLRGYIKEYVTCHTCRSSDTELTKDVSRLFFIQCKACGSRFAVSSIKSGFTAMVGKRAALRRAAEATAGK